MLITKGQYKYLPTKYYNEKLINNKKQVVKKNKDEFKYEVDPQTSDIEEK